MFFLQKPFEYEVRCPIHGSIPFNEREKKIINHPFFQRLRHISQLGFGSYVYPSAVHTRFTHSLGAMHLSGKIFEQLFIHGNPSLESLFPQKKLAYYYQLIRFAALLHDIGHPPFSHVSESILPSVVELSLPFLKKKETNRRATHEDFSVAIVIELSKAQHALITPEEKQDIIALLTGDIQLSASLFSDNNSVQIFPLLHQMISGEIDVDRMDYLLRDSYFAGVTYGNFDLNRIISSMSCWLHESTGNILLSVDNDGIPAYDDFLLARSNMFLQVYFHKTLSAFNQYLQNAFKEKEVFFQINGNLEEFLHCTENLFFEALKEVSHKKWAGKVIHRTVAKTLLRWINPNQEQKKRILIIKELLQKEGIEYIFTHPCNEFSSQLSYKTIKSDTLVSKQQAFGNIVYQPISETSPLLKIAKKNIEILQIYVFEDTLEFANEIINHTFSVKPLFT